jgi:hypothetical protein
MFRVIVTMLFLSMKDLGSVIGMFWIIVFVVGIMPHTTSHTYTRFFLDFSNAERIYWVKTHVTRNRIRKVLD